MLRLGSVAAALIALAAVSGCVSINPNGAPVTTAAPGSTVPPAATVAPVPTTAPAPSAGQAEGSLCGIVTIAEVSAAAGGQPAAPGEDYEEEGGCNWDVGAPNDLGIPNAFVNLRRDFGGALDETRTDFPGGEDLAIGDDAYWSPAINVLYFKTGGSTYAVQIVTVDADEVDERELAIALATTAAGRL